LSESVEAQNELAQQKQELDVLRKILQESNSNPTIIVSPNDKKPKKRHKKEKFLFYFFFSHPFKDLPMQKIFLKMKILFQCYIQQDKDLILLEM
jgi:transcriptional accessory protein Tex/SPT6